MIQRSIGPQLERLAKQFPVVTILGPRQSGKTTLARSQFPNHTYANLEQTSVLRAAEDDPEGFLKTNPAPLILDEVQRTPGLLSDLQLRVDRDKIKGEYILTGSHQPKLAEGISQSLAGRTGILTLLPCTIDELESGGIRLERDEYIYRGFMPGVHFDGIDPDNFYRSYFQTYVERDVRLLIQVSNQRLFETFVRLLAGRIGQVVNLQAMAGDVGVSSTTLAQWLSVLEASFIVFRLPSYSGNFGKRLVKSPKIYFYEVGLAAWLLGIETPKQVTRDPLIGGLFENMVVAEAMKARLNAGKEPNLYYYRDRYGFEVDLLAVHGRAIMPIEIKSAMTYDKSFSSNLRVFCEATALAQNPTVVYAGDTLVNANGVTSTNFANVGHLISRWDAEMRGE
ncbi:MAG: ATP-binding protein [Oscillospiraceae bacterium]|jgi:predicted AAA+ superfamily ATPase|nr:ATP-binding protein [Oscillospiraceae bacterium]